MRADDPECAAFSVRQACADAREIVGEGVHEGDVEITVGLGRCDDLDRAAGEFELCGGIDGVVVRCGDLAGGVVGKNGAGAEFVEARQGSAILAGAGDPDMVEMAEEEITAATAELAQLEVELQRMLLPKDPDDARPAFVEIRAGTEMASAAGRSYS